MDFVECLPELACLVDINLASLLSISLSKFFANLVCFKSLEEDATFRREVSCTVETEIGSEHEFVWMEKVSELVVPEIDRRAFPVDLERIGLVWKSVQRRANVSERHEVLVFTSDFLDIVWSLSSAVNLLWWSWYLDLDDASIPDTWFARILPDGSYTRSSRSNGLVSSS